MMRESVLLLLLPFAAAFTVQSPPRRIVSSLDAAKIGLFFGTSTGSTESVAERIQEEFGDLISEPIDVETIQGSVADEFAKYNALIVGTPTWNTGMCNKI